MPTFEENLEAFDERAARLDRIVERGAPVELDEQGIADLQSLLNAWRWARNLWPGDHRRAKERELELVRRSDLKRVANHRKHRMALQAYVDLVSGGPDGDGAVLFVRQDLIDIGRPLEECIESVNFAGPLEPMTALEEVTRRFEYQSTEAARQRLYVVRDKRLPDGHPLKSVRLPPSSRPRGSF